MSLTDIVCIMGPTGAGKTASALAIPGDKSVINFDSRQVYRDFPIVTAQPSDSEKAACPHLLYGFMDSRDKIDTAGFSYMAEEAIAKVKSEQRLPVLVGGTGLYLKTLLGGIAPIPAIPVNIREQVLERVRIEGPQILHAELRSIDPDYAAVIHPNDSQRNARAAEVYLATGKNMTQWHRADHGHPKYNALKLGIWMELDELEPLLVKRVDLMIEAGAVDEVSRAWENCPDSDAPAWSGIGCAELLDHIRGRTTIDEARKRWVSNTRAYAKRQLTWFRKEKDVQWFRPGQEMVMADAVRVWLVE